MKKIIISFLFLLAAASSTLLAGPARPGMQTYVQPDGSTVQLEAHGDEWVHWLTDASGQVVVIDADGYVRPGTLPAAEELSKKSAQRYDAERRRVMRASSNTNVGTRRFLVLLIQFSDKKFTISNPNQAFSSMLNDDNYTQNGCIGSVKEFFQENSNGRFTPVFDVVGPITVDNTYSYYGANDSSGNDQRPWDALAHALKKIDASLDMSPYDSDGDKTLDAVLFYYAGNNEAEKSTDVNAIWPHEYYLSYAGVSSNDRKVNGYYVDCYSCTSEFRGTGSTMCGIGTACHEFGHALGLPDFYDTDYTTNGSAGGLYFYSTMCSGSYNGDGCIPPYFNAEERIILGWMDGLTAMPTNGSVTIPAVSTDFAYKTNSDVANEYFVYECRSGQRWDSPMQPGLIVYHVDKSSNIVTGSTKASSMWSGNKINAYGDHPCFYIVPSGSPTSLNYSNASMVTYSNAKKLAFPGGGSQAVTSYKPVAWSGNEMSYSFTAISFNTSDRTVSLNISTSSCLLTGQVRTTKNEGIPGASVKLYASATPVSERGGLLKSVAFAAGTVLTETVTDDAGNFTLDMAPYSGSSFDLEVSAAGYVTSRVSVEVASGTNVQNITLLAENPVEEELLYKYDPESGLHFVGGGNDFSIMGAVGFTAEELLENVGRRIDAISFLYYSPVVKGVYVVVDFGTERQCWIPVENPVSGSYMTVDLRGYGLTIPEGKDCYFGYAVEVPGYGYPLAFENGSVKEGGMYYSLFNETTSTWRSYEGNIIVDVSLAPSVGYNYIQDRKNGVYSVGDVFPLELVTASNYRNPTEVKWYYDDEPVSGPSVSLTRSGIHTVTAELTLQDGGRQILELEITVN